MKTLLSFCSYSLYLMQEIKKTLFCYLTNKMWKLRF